MINRTLLSAEVQDYIRNFQGDTSQLAFSGSPFENISAPELIQQIQSRRRIEKKLPTWYTTRNILYPQKLNLEQTSSEITAAYKASIIGGDTLADITGGFGVDTFYFSEKFNSVHHFETNEILSELAEHNFEVFGKTNINFFPENGLQSVLNRHYDVIYADPSRRHDSKGKVFILKDCEPNIVDNISRILNHCNKFLLKTSPMLDISVGLNELQSVSEIHIVAVDNEMKELLWVLKKDCSEAIKIRTINFTKNGPEVFNFQWDDKPNPTFSLPKKYLFEPNVAILKSGAFPLVSEQLKVDKLHKNTHLFTSIDLFEFPGRVFLIEKIIAYTKPAMRAAPKFKKANIATRNFPETVETLRNKWKIAEGGNVYLFFITNMQESKQLLVCSKI